jgi:ribosomal protein S12 methylthiotransferase
MYSPEENTKAFELDDNVPQDVKLERKEELMTVQENISLEINQKNLVKLSKLLSIVWIKNTTLGEQNTTHRK